MKYHILILFIIVLTLSCVPVQVAPTVSMENKDFFKNGLKVAVLDLNYVFEDKGQIGITNYQSAGKDGGRVVANLLAAELATFTNLKLIERGEIAKLLDEQAFQQSGVINSENAVKIGNMTGAEAIVTGELTDYVIWDNLSGAGSTISFSIKMIDVESGSVVLNAAISRARPYIDSFANVQLTAKEIVESIKQRNE